MCVVLTQQCGRRPERSASSMSASELGTLRPPNYKYVRFREVLMSPLGTTEPCRIAYAIWPLTKAKRPIVYWRNGLGRHGQLIG